MASACRSRIRSIHSQSRITRHREDLTQNTLTPKSALRLPGTGFTTGVHYAGLEARVAHRQDYNAIILMYTAGLRGNLGEFGDYFKTWQWESGFRYSEDDRGERLGGVVNNNALRAALLDTNPATALTHLVLIRTHQRSLIKSLPQPIASAGPH